MAFLILKHPKFILLLFLILVAFGLTISPYFLSKKFYHVLPVTYTENGYPLIEAIIETKKCSLEVRLGSRFPLFLTKDTLKSLHTKNLKPAEWMDIQGQLTITPSYLIPRISIGEFALTNVIAIQDDTDNNTLGKLLGEDFSKHHLFIDLPHDRFILCHSFSQLKAKKLVHADWIQVPFQINRAGIIFEVKTDHGIRKLALNTTSKDTLLKSNFANERVSSTFFLGSRNFGPFAFKLLKISDSLSEVDGFIGMDLLKSTSIYLDCSRQIAYIEPMPNYLERFPVVFKRCKIPSFPIHIENHDYFLELDLGNPFLLSLTPEALQKLQKTLYGTAQWSDFKGNQYESPVYQLSQIQAGSFILKDILTTEIREDFYTNVSKNTLTTPDFGSIGLPFVKKYNLFLDFKNCVIYASSSLALLQQKGIISRKLLEIPFEVHSDGIILSVETDEGTQQLILDTGATYTGIRSHSDFTSKFCLMDHDFGSAHILPIDLSTHLNYDGYLGMDFLCSHSIFIDFPNQRIFLDLESSSTPYYSSDSRIPALSFD